MPQMFPMYWLYLFILFSLIMVLFNSLNYFILTHKYTPVKVYKNKLTNFNWKW